MNKRDFEINSQSKTFANHLVLYYSDKHNNSVICSTSLAFLLFLGDSVGNIGEMKESGAVQTSIRDGGIDAYGHKC